MCWRKGLVLKFQISLLALKFVVLEFHISVLEKNSCFDEKFSWVQISDFWLGDEVWCSNFTFLCWRKSLVLKLQISVLAINFVVRISDFCVGKKFLVLAIKFPVRISHSCVAEKASGVQLSDSFGHKVSFIKISQSRVGKKFLC